MRSCGCLVLTRHVYDCDQIPDSHPSAPKFPEAGPGLVLLTNQKTVLVLLTNQMTVLVPAWRGGVVIPDVKAGLLLRLFAWKALDHHPPPAPPDPLIGQ